MRKAFSAFESKPRYTFSRLPERTIKIQSVTRHALRMVQTGTEPFESMPCSIITIQNHLDRIFTWLLHPSEMQIDQPWGSHKGSIQVQYGTELPIEDIPAGEGPTHCPVPGLSDEIGPAPSDNSGSTGESIHTEFERDFGADPLPPTWASLTGSAGGTHPPENPYYLCLAIPGVAGCHPSAPRVPAKGRGGLLQVVVWMDSLATRSIK